jgi:hypothetical protein
MELLVTFVLDSIPFKSRLPVPPKPTPAKAKTLTSSAESVTVTGPTSALTPAPAPAPAPARPKTHLDLLEIDLTFEVLGMTVSLPAPPELPGSKRAQSGGSAGTPAVVIDMERTVIVTNSPLVAEKLAVSCAMSEVDKTVPAAGAAGGTSASGADTGAGGPRPASADIPLCEGLTSFPASPDDLAVVRVGRSEWSRRFNALVQRIRISVVRDSGARPWPLMAVRGAVMGVVVSLKGTAGGLAYSQLDVIRVETFVDQVRCVCSCNVCSEVSSIM